MWVCCSSFEQVEKLALVFIYIVLTMILKVFKVLLVACFFMAVTSYENQVFIPLGFSPLPDLGEQQYGIFLFRWKEETTLGKKVYSQQKQHFVFKDLDARLSND